MWIYQKELANSIPGLPKISKDVQANARKTGQLEYIKIGRHIVYKKEWVEQYLSSLQKLSLDTGGKQ
ncbi:MAG: hypothetical protein PHE73_09015 [Sulfurovaceae bacterium]|nr:hypothetical protein [Sulfurovaceae bacterium]